MKTAAAASIAILAFGSVVSASADGIDTSALLAWASDVETLVDQPALQTLDSQISAALPTGVYDSILAQQTASYEALQSAFEAQITNSAAALSALSSIEHHTLGVSTEAWESLLTPSLRSAYDAAQTSIASAYNSILEQHFGNAAGAVYAPRGFGMALGAAAAAIGGAAILL